MSHIENTLAKLIENIDLSFDEAFSAMEEIMTGNAAPVKLAAWLTALRIKGEHPDEIAGCASVMKKYATRIRCDDPFAVDIVGTGGDKSFSINVSTAAAFVAAGAGVTVAKHGNRAVSSKSGSADVLSSLGININASPEKMEECLNKVGISFLFASTLHPAMKNIMPVRRELGVRTVFNIIGPLTNPAGIKRYLLGVYSDKLCFPMARAALGLGYERLLVVHGSDGLDEITVTGPTHVCEVLDKSITEYKISPEQFGMDIAAPQELKGGTPEENAEILKQILTGKIKGAKQDIVILNAAAAIMLADKADSLTDSIKKARESISGGAAYEKLQRMVEFF